MAGPHGLAAPPEIQPTSTSAAASLSLSSSPVSLPFRNTQLFQLVMKCMSYIADNANVADWYGRRVGTSRTAMNLVWWPSLSSEPSSPSNDFNTELTYYTAMQTWGIGYTMCQFWLCVDYLMSNASVLNLLLISFDRYFSVTRPLSYRPRRTTRKALIMIACTYIISVILWPPWIISWPYIEGKFTVEPGTCVVQFLETNPYVTVGTAVAAFYLPVTILIVLYSRVYWETRKRRRDFGKLQASQHPTVTNDSVRTHRSVSQKIRKKVTTMHGSHFFRSCSLSSIATSSHSLNRFPRRSMRRDTSTNSFAKNNERGSLKKGAWSVNDSKSSNRTRNRVNWLKMCSTRSHSSSEDSSEAQVMNIDDTSLSSSLYTAKRKNTSPPLSPLPANDETVSGETQTENSPRSGSMRFRTRPTDRPTFDTYTVLIELKDEGARPSVRLSNCDTVTQEAVSRRESRCRSRSDCNVDLAEDINRQTSLKGKTLHRLQKMVASRELGRRS
ncbi:7 transmembrane receptor, partial [Ostertagia ostertagi]